MDRKQHLLFVCTANHDRSPTAESLFRDHPRCEARSCGISPFAATPASERLLEWADIIFCMEEHHRAALLAMSDLTETKPVVVLSVPDMYVHGEVELVNVLNAKLGPWLEART